MDSVRYPHPCGAELAARVLAGADPDQVVPGDYFIVRGGENPDPPEDPLFSCAVGPTLEAAACAVPHGAISVSSVASVRDAGAKVTWIPEEAGDGTMNQQHVNVAAAGWAGFLVPPIKNPVSRRDRVNGRAAGRGASP